jgi:NADPH:quinone reductase-like Zn-dependent oxidoreductase
MVCTPGKVDFNDRWPKDGSVAPKPPSKRDLVFIKELLRGGKISPVIDRSYKLIDLPEAIRYLEKGHARGKIIITI